VITSELEISMCRSGGISKYPIVIVVPYYEDSAAIKCLFQELSTQFNHDIFVLAVDDGSLREPLSEDLLENAGITGGIIRLSRNLGHQGAIATALTFVAEKLESDQLLVIMDSDGEDLPSTIPRLIERLGSPDVDIAVARRKNRIESVWFKLFYRLYKFLFSVLTGREIFFGNFMALKSNAVKKLVLAPELFLHIAATVISSKSRLGVCEIDRGRRYAGQSKMNFTGLVVHGFRAIMVFAEDVLVRVAVGCALLSIGTASGMVLATILKIFGFATPGWFSVAIGLLFLVLLQTIVITIVALMLLILVGIVRGDLNSRMHAKIELIESVSRTLLRRL